MLSRTNLFITVVILLLLVLYLASALVQSTLREEVTPPEVREPIESVNTEETFAEDAKKYDEVVIVTDDEAEAEPEDGAEDQGNQEEDADEAAEDEVATSTPLPSVFVTAGGITREGTLGSYCWEDICATSMISDLPYTAIPVSASSSVNFTVEAENAPERVLIFVKEVGGTSVQMSRELTVDEILAGAFALDQLPGEHLLFITGVWEGGMDVVHAFKINIF